MCIVIMAHPKCNGTSAVPPHIISNTYLLLYILEEIAGVVPVTTQNIIIYNLL